MDILQMMTGGVVTIVLYGLLAACVFKLFNISSELGEIKELLKDMQRINDRNLFPTPHSEPPAEPPEVVYNLEVVDQESGDQY